MPTKAQLETALRNADKAGDTVAAKKLANAIKAGMYSDAPAQDPTGEIPAPFGEQQAVAPVPARERSFGERIVGGAEALAASTIGAVPPLIGLGVGAAQGAVEYLGRGDFSQPPGELVKQRAMEGAQRLTIEPPSEAGREYAQDIGETLAPLAGIAPNLAIESAALRSGARQFRDVAGAKVGASVPANRPIFESAKKGDIRQALHENTTESIGWKMEGNKIVPNMLERNLLDKGVSDKTLAATRTLGRQDKRAAMRMLDLAEDYVKGKEGSDLNRPSVAIGERIMERFDVLRDAQRRASDNIGKAVASKEIKGRPVDVSDIQNEFASALQERGAVISDGTVRFKDLTGFDVADKKLINETYRTLGREFKDASELHRIKRALTERLNYDQKVAVGGRPLSADAEGLLKSVRGRINDKLREMSPSYAAANDQFAQAAQGMKPFAESLGRKFDPESTRAENFTGTQLRKALSNYANADEMVSAVENLNTTANALGGKFGNEIMPLVRLNSDLEGLLGSFAPQSLQGVLEKAGTNVAQRTLGGMAETALEAGRAVKRRTSMWDAPVQEKVELINQLREQVKAQP